MRRLLVLVLAGFMALMPVSVLSGNSSAPADAQEMPCHSHDTQSNDGSAVSCGDLQGCCGGFLTSAVTNTFDMLSAPQSARLGQDLHAGFVPDQLDPPPVV